MRSNKELDHSQPAQSGRELVGRPRAKLDKHRTREYWSGCLEREQCHDDGNAARRSRGDGGGREGAGSDAGGTGLSRRERGWLCDGEIMKLGVFSHMDRGLTPLDRFFEDRLKLVEAYDRAG